MSESEASLSDDDIELEKIIRPKQKPSMEEDAEDEDTEMEVVEVNCDKTVDMEPVHDTEGVMSDAESTVVPREEPKPKTKKQVTIDVASSTANPRRSRGEMADVQAGRHNRQVRLQLMLKLKASTKKTPAEVCVRHLHMLYEILRKEDGRMMIMPWNEALRPYEGRKLATKV